jgi:hypothetical protein
VYFDTTAHGLRPATPIPLWKAHRTKDLSVAHGVQCRQDGSELAFLARNDAREVELRVLTVGTGSLRTLYRAPQGRMSAPLAWTDGSRLIAELANSSGTPALWSIGARGEQPARILSGCCRENDVRINRAGRGMGFAAGAQRGESWLLKDY